MEFCREWKRALIILVFVFVGLAKSFAIVKLPAIFTDRMVFQRNKPIVVWGWGDPKEKVTVTFNFQKRSTFANEEGRWKVVFNPQKPGGPFEMIVSGANKITISDIMIGDVWVCAGQSNMEFALRKANDAEQEIAEANYPLLRHFKVPNGENILPQDETAPSMWKVCDTKNAAEFTAVGYFFARELVRELGIPIGIINISRGGSNIEKWISVDAFETSAEFPELVSSLKGISSDLLSDKEKTDLPGVLYNAMVNPIIHFPVKGVVWYQGEANIGRGFEYRKVFALLINDWRKKWNEELPFYFVQLPAFKGHNGNSNSGSKWAELRESQAVTASLPNTGMVVTTDLGDPEDLHPRNKKDVGRRLAAVALKNTYEIDRVCSGPAFREMQVGSDQIVLKFDNTGSGLLVNDSLGIVKGFEILGSDGIFHPVAGTVSGEDIILGVPAGLTPLQIRYGWADDVSHLNLFNKEGFPAVPFRTDSRMPVTARARFIIRQSSN